MMLTEQEKDLIKLEAKDLAFAIIKETTLEHIKNCPHGQKIKSIKTFLFGVLIGVALVSGGGSFGIYKIITHLIH